MKRSVIIPAILLCALVGCNRTENTPVPRRTAYPRIQEYDTTYVVCKDAPLHLEVNAQAELMSVKMESGPVAIDIHYPIYKASIYCSFTPVNEETVEEVIKNRNERMSLNLGAAKPWIKELTNDAGYDAVLVKSLSTITTPLQFIAANPENPEWVVSGAVFFHDVSSSTPVDSVSPMVAVIERDIITMLNSLSAK